MNAMRHLLYAFFIALTNNYDNIGARIAYSVEGIKITTPINFWISVITFVISFLAASSGTLIKGSLGKEFSSVIAMVLLVAIGSWMILEPYLKKKCIEKFTHENSRSILCIFLKPKNADTDKSKHIDLKEATLLGIALSINNIGGGLSAGMIGINSLLVGLLSAMLSFFALWAGNYFAEFFIKRNMTNKATFLGGILLIAIGIEQLF
ncbi:MAG: manganese efflux pump [Thermodesulfobacteriota bacterium]